MHTADRLGDRYAGLLARIMTASAAHARVVVAAALVLVGLSVVVTLRYLDISTTTTGLIADHVDFRRAETDFRGAFPVFNHLLVVVVDAETPEGADAAAGHLAEAMRARPDLFGDVFAPADDPFLATYGLLLLDLEDLTRLADRIAGAQSMMAALAQDPSLAGLFDLLARALDAEAAGEDVPGDLAAVVAGIAQVIERSLDGRPGALSWQSLVAGDAVDVSTRRLIVSPAAEGAGDGTILAAMRAMIAGLDIAPYAPPTVRLTGPVALEHAELQTVSQGTEIAGALSFTLVTLLLVWGLRSGRLIAAVLLPLLVGLVLTFGFATLTVGRLNLISMAFAVLFVGLAVDFGIHVALRLREAQGRGQPLAAALAETGIGVGRALSLSAVSAAIGFLAFWPTDYRGLAELGVIAAGGMGVALVVNLTLTPALLALMPARARPVPAGPAGAKAPGPIGRLVDRRPVGILIVAALLGIAGTGLAREARFDLNPLNLQDPAATPVRTFLDLAADSRTTPYTLNALAADRAAADALASALGELDAVAHATTLSSFVPTEQDRKFAVLDQIALFVTPVFLALPEPPPTVAEQAAATDALIAALAAADPAVTGAEGAALGEALTRLAATAADRPVLWADVEARLLAGFDGYLDDLDRALGATPLGLDDLPAALVDRWVAPDGRVRVEIAPAEEIGDNDSMRRFADAVRPVAPITTGAPVVLTEASRVIVRAFLIATGLSLGAIAILMAVLLRRLDDVALTLLPLLLAAVLTLATATAAGLALNFANVIVLPLLFGLGVSSSIHMVMRRRRDGVRAADLMATSTPRAVLFSVLTTAASFGSLATTAHRGMSSMGALLTVAIVYTLITTLVVLPALMRWLDRRRQGVGP